MPNEPLKYCATDNEIYDVLMSARQRINENSLHEMALQRGIFFSPHEMRDTLASQISLLPHDHYSVTDLLGQSENPNRAEKVTSIKLDKKFPLDELKDVVREYQEQTTGEKVIPQAYGPENYVVKVQYSELDHGKTRLLQRRNREADIRIITEGDATIIRMPANERARAIVNNLKDKLDAKAKDEIPVTLIEISDLSSDDRTRFFTSLISELEGHKLSNVTNVKVQSGSKPPADEPEADAEEEDDDTVQATDEMLSVVESVAIKGESLLSSPEYQDLKKKGFYITAVTWVGTQKTTPNNRVVFEAGFEEPEEGKGFRYNVLGVHRLVKGDYTSTRRPLTADHKQEIFPIIEHTARKVLEELRKKAASSIDAQEAGK